MFHMKSGEWKWYFSDKISSFTPPPDPIDLLADADIIKDVPGTLVFRRNGFFFKWEKYPSGNWGKRLKRYLFPRSAKEFAALCRLQKQELIVTPPEAYAVGKNAGILVTREIAGSLSVMEYICRKYEKNEALTKEFLSSWGKFWGDFINSGFYFPDFHCGNVLFVEAEQRFVLVDLYGVRKPLIIRSKQKERMIFRQLKDSMEFFSDKELKLVLQSAGIAENEEQFFSYLRLHAAMADDVLKRRLRSFDEYAVRRRPDRKEWSFQETDQRILPEEVIEEIWMDDFALQHHGIPHLHLVKRCGNKLELEKCFSSASEKEEFSLRKRLEISGFDPELYIYCLTSGGKAVVCHKKVFS